MTQLRLINFGSTADAAKTKTINAQFFGPQVLRASAPFLLAVAPDELQLQPHSVVFANGVVLVEDEIKTFTIPTLPTAVDYTLLYQHIDEDIIGGSVATLELRTGLFESLPNSVILGWIRYPGGSVEIDATMIFRAPTGQVQGVPVTTVTSARHSLAATTTARSADVTETTVAPQLGLTVPATPHQLTIDPLPSRLLGWNAGVVRVFCHDDGQEYTRVEVAPGPQEFMLNPTTGVATFNSVDEGKTIDVVDLTYGQGAVFSVNQATSTRYVDIAYSFELHPEPLTRVFVDYVPLDSYTIDAVEVLDGDGVAGVIAVDKTEPSTPDGSIARLSVRLLEGRFSSRTGEVLTVRLRKTLGGNGEGLELRTRVTTYDSPF